MKTPRVTDFDPNAPVLELGWPLDDLPVIERAQHAQLPFGGPAASNVTTDDAMLPPKPAAIPPPPAVPTERDVRPRQPVPPVRPALPRRRPIKQRHPFDIYDDQLESLRRLALEERMRGGFGSMSAMVREALDAYIGQRMLPAPHAAPDAEPDVF